MKRLSLIVVTLLALSMIVSACTSTDNVSTNAAPHEQILRSGSEPNSVELTQVTDTTWVHTTYEDFNGKRTGSNGLVVETSDGLVLIDTPWNNEQTKELIQLTKKTFNKDLSLAIITHAHADRIGGIQTLLENNVDVRSTPLTARIADRNGYGKPAPSLDPDMDIRVGEVDIRVHYPGAGHSEDNIVIWFPQSRLLFGGCIIKSMDSENLGSTADATLQQWPVSVGAILKKYADADIVIPGHGRWGGIELIEHTLELLNP